MAELEQQAHEIAGRPFNVGSPRQIGEILFGELNLPGGKSTGYEVGIAVAHRAQCICRQCPPPIVRVTVAKNDRIKIRNCLLDVHFELAPTDVT